MNTHWGVKKEKTPRKAGNQANEKHISVQDNRIYFYSGVNRNACVELNKKIGELETKKLDFVKYSWYITTINKGVYQFRWWNYRKWYCFYGYDAKMSSSD